MTQDQMEVEKGKIKTGQLSPSRIENCPVFIPIKISNSILEALKLDENINLKPLSFDSGFLKLYLLKFLAGDKNTSSGFADCAIDELYLWDFARVGSSWNGWGNEGQSCYSLGCESYGNGGSSGGGSTANAHTEYCDTISNVVSLFSGARIIGTAGGILSLGGISAGFGLNSLNGGITDIRTFIQSSYAMHAPSPYFGLDWNAANINWIPFINQWTALGHGAPTTNNGGYGHILALYFQSVGVGSGPSNVTPPSALLPEDPDPGVSC